MRVIDAKKVGLEISPPIKCTESYILVWCLAYLEFRSLLLVVPRSARLSVACFVFEARLSCGTDKLCLCRLFILLVIKACCVVLGTKLKLMEDLYVINHISERDLREKSIEQRWDGGAALIRDHQANLIDSFFLNLPKLNKPSLSNFKECYQLCKCLCSNIYKMRGCHPVNRNFPDMHMILARKRIGRNLGQTKSASA